MFPVHDETTYLLPLALALLWLIAALVCRGRATPALIGSAPLAILLSWFVWMQAQGWPGSGDQRFPPLGEIALAVLFALVVGRLVRSRVTRRRVAPEEPASDEADLLISDAEP